MKYDYSDLITLTRSYKPEWELLVSQLRALAIPADFPLQEFFTATHRVILQAADFSLLLERDPQLKSLPLADLQALNRDLYAALEPGANYAQCPANPDFAVQHYGQELGGLTAAVYTRSRSLRNSLLAENYLDAVLFVRLFQSLHSLAEAGNRDYSTWLSEYRSSEMSDFSTRVAFQIQQRFNPQADYYRRVVESADLSDPRYLYRFGVYVSEHDLALAQFILQYPASELAAIARFIVQSWMDGFTRAKKDYRIKRYANLMVPLGMERLSKLLIAELTAIGITPLVSSPLSNGINRQFSYDHRFDRALILDREYVDLSLDTSAEVYAALKDTIALQAGPVYVELFGETPFAPEAKTTALQLSPAQQALSREQNGRVAQIYYQYYRRDEASFTIIAFPSPEIGDKFPQIFADTLKINLLDSMRYAAIQQKIIDVLDTAEYVHVLGKPGNDTDIRVRLHPLTDPEHQTNFENCVADVNIPVGEVFTSPLLTGTTGTLHVEDIYLGNLRYFNLKMHFEDGWVKDYSCTNFPNSAEGKKYIHQNLLLPHDSLPIGEFAIGTNTTAYQIARKYDILALLPILIIEKMGPHFAIGDTCFSHEEEAPHPNFLNGKEMIAVENEKSATRQADPVNAYTQKHMDITLPYEMLQSITAITKEGLRHDIIRDGRFVVPGTEELNIPLDEGWQIV